MPRIFYFLPTIPARYYFAVEVKKKSSKKQPFRRVAEGVFQYETSGTFYARFRHKGKRVFQMLGSQSSPCKNLEEAKRLYRELRNEEDRGTADRTLRSLTLRQLIEEHRVTMKGAESTASYKSKHLDRLANSTLADKKVVDITPQDLEVFISDYEQGKQPTKNKAISVVRQVFETAKKKKCIRMSPAKELAYLDSGDKKKRHTPSLQEFKAIVESIRQQKYSDTARNSADLVEFIGEAGLGQAECFDLKWQDINWHDRTITVIRRKTRRQFTIPIYASVEPLLRRLQAARQDQNPVSKVFSIRNPKKAMKSACERLGLPDYTPRSLRRMFIRKARRLGVPAQFTAKWQGHSDTKMVMKIYDEPTDKESQEFAAIMT